MENEDILKVYGCLRSGNHWLMEVLYENFYKGRVNLARRILDPDKEEVLRYHKHSHYDLFGGHRTPQYAVLVNKKHGFKPIYIYRDGRDMLVSLWRDPKFHRTERWERAEGTKLPEVHRRPFDEWLRRPVSWGMWAQSRPQKGDMPPPMHWYLYCRKWLHPKNHPTRTGILQIRYEDLYYKFVQTMQEITGFYKLDPIHKKWVRPKKPSGQFAYKARPGEWGNHFSDKDLEYFYSIVPKNFPCLYQGGHE